LENEKLEVKGQVCPMPVAHTKRKLEKMQSGQVLEVVGDCSPGFDNIQSWAKNQGHEVLEASKNENEFLVKIRKH
jgi:tRNA 2-thiouridine synthesizing protein A